MKTIGPDNFGGPAFSWPGGLAWIDNRYEEGYFRLLTNSSGQVSTLCTIPVYATDYEATWVGGRFYWLRSTDLSDFEDGSKDVHVRTDVLTMAPRETMPTVLVTAFEIDALRVAGSRLVWLERKKSSKSWSAMTMTTSGAAASSIPGFGSAAADFKLSETMLVWAPRKGSTSVHVLSIDSGGRLSATPTILPAGAASGAVYQGESLSLDGSRVAWSSRSSKPQWHVYTWRLGDAQPQRISTQPSERPSGLEDELDKASSGLVNPLVTGDRVSWRSWRGSARAVLTWTSGESSPSTLATVTSARAMWCSLPDRANESPGWSSGLSA